MNRLEAHERLAERYSADPEALRGWLPDGTEARPIHGVDPLVALLVAAVSLSGQLEDAETLDDLQAACEHFATLFGAEIVTAEEWNAEALEVIGELIEWGSRQTAAAVERN